MVASSVILAVPMERRCCCSQTSSGVWQWEGGGKPCCKEERRWKREGGRESGGEWDADSGAREAPGGRGRAGSFPASPGHVGPISRVPYTAACSCPWPRCGSPCAPPGLHTSTRRLWLLQWFLQRGDCSQSPDSRHSPSPYSWERGLPAPTFHSSQPWSWQVGLWLQDRCRCLSWGCQLCPMPGWGTGRHPVFTGGHPGATHTSCVCSGPCCSCSAHPAPDLALYPTTSLPACPQTPHTSHLTLRGLALPCAPSSALPGWWHNAGCPEQGDRSSGWALTFLMLL